MLWAISHSDKTQDQHDRRNQKDDHAQGDKALQPHGLAHLLVNRCLEMRDIGIGRHFAFVHIFLEQGIGKIDFQRSDLLAFIHRIDGAAESFVQFQIFRELPLHLGLRIFPDRHKGSTFFILNIERPEVRQCDIGAQHVFQRGFVQVIHEEGRGIRQDLDIDRNAGF